MRACVCVGVGVGVGAWVVKPLAMEMSTPLRMFSMSPWYSCPAATVTALKDVTDRDRA